MSKIPVYEPVLDSVVGRAWGRNLNVSMGVDASITADDMVFITRPD